MLREPSPGRCEPDPTADRLDQRGADLGRKRGDVLGDAAWRSRGAARAWTGLAAALLVPYPVAWARARSTSAHSGASTGSVTPTVARARPGTT